MKTIFLVLTLFCASLIAAPDETIKVEKNQEVTLGWSTSHTDNLVAILIKRGPSEAGPFRLWKVLSPAHNFYSFVPVCSAYFKVSGYYFPGRNEEPIKLILVRVHNAEEFVEDTDKGPSLP